MSIRLRIEYNPSAPQNDIGVNITIVAGPMCVKIALKVTEDEIYDTGLSGLRELVMKRITDALQKYSETSADDDDEEIVFTFTETPSVTNAVYDWARGLDVTRSSAVEIVVTL